MDERETEARSSPCRCRRAGRRVLVVYREAASRLRTSAASLPVEALQKTAKLVRVFAEDYHEKQLDEGTSFPR